MKHTLLLSLALAALCAAGARADTIPAAPPSAPLPAPVRVGVPEAWGFSRVYDQSLPSRDRWWQTLDDPVLNSLISRAEDANFNLRAALRRIEIANTNVSQARAGYYPTVSAQLGYTAARQSGAMTSHAVKGTSVNYMNLGLSARWEIDLFGRVGAQVKAGQAEVLLSKADYAAAMVSLCSSLAKQYVNLRALQEEVALAVEHAHSQEQIVSMTLARQEAGLASALEVAQARQVLYSTQASIPPLEAQVQTSINSIAVLLGVYPGEIQSELEAPRPLPNAFQNPCVGTPLEMLRRRPDIAEAEAQMAVYAAQLGVAKKDYLPTLALEGSVGVEAHNPKDLFTDKGFVYTVAPTLSWTIFDGLARKYKTAAARQQMEAAVDDYNMTVLTAVQEVDNAAVTYDACLRDIAMLKKLVEQSQTALNLSVDLYRSSLAPFTNVVDAQIDLLQYQNQEIEMRAQALASLISLYEALGGGW